MKLEIRNRIVCLAIVIAAAAPLGARSVCRIGSTAA